VCTYARIKTYLYVDICMYVHACFNANIDAPCVYRNMQVKSDPITHVTRCSTSDYHVGLRSRPETTRGIFGGRWGAHKLSFVMSDSQSLQQSMITGTLPHPTRC